MCGHRHTQLGYKQGDVWETRHCLRSLCFVTGNDNELERQAVMHLQIAPNLKQRFLGLVWPRCALPSIFCTSEWGRLDNHGITALCGSSGLKEEQLIRSNFELS